MKISENIQQNSSEFNFWKNFYNDFQAHADDIKKLEKWSQPAMLILHLELILNQKYVSAFTKARCFDADAQPLIAPIFKSDFIEVKLNRITTTRSLPLHDHPGASGSMLVISGRVQTVSCEQEKTDLNRQTRSQLKIVANSILSIGDSSCFTKKHNNIHSITALTDTAIIFTVHVNPFPNTRQSYFFPLSPQQKPNTYIITQRVRAKTLQKIHHNIKESSYVANSKSNLN